MDHPLKSIKEILSQGEKSKKVIGGTGFSTLDETIKDLNAGELILIGGRPALGKTSLALDIVKNICSDNNKTALYFSLEVDKEDIANRLLIKESKISYKDLKENISGDQNKLIQAMNQLINYKIFIDEKTFTIENIIFESREMAQNINIDLIVIDYLQLVKSTEEKSYSKNFRLIFEELKQLAIELSCAIVILSQLNRTHESSKTKRPGFHSITEFDTIENLVHKILLIYREDIYFPETENKNIAEVIVLKNKNGDVGTIKLRWNRDTLSFVNLSDSI